MHAPGREQPAEHHRDLATDAQRVGNGVGDLESGPTTAVEIDDDVHDRRRRRIREPVDGERGDPAAAVSICDRVLTTEMSAAAFVARGAALGDLRRYRAALDSVCLGLALDPNTYAGNAARRAFRMARAGGQNFISALNLACETGQVPPGKNVSLPHFCREMAAGALASAGHRDLVEVALIGARRADDRSLRVRQWCQQNAVAR